MESTQADEKWLSNYGGEPCAKDGWSLQLLIVFTTSLVVQPRKEEVAVFNLTFERRMR